MILSPSSFEAVLRFSAIAALSLAALLALSGCVTTEADLAGQKISTSAECLTGICRFDNAPLRLKPETIRLRGRLYDFNRLSAPLQFVDGEGREWLAPEETLTDGASIPAVFVPIIGFPREPEFANAAALHDAYCGIGNETGPVYHAKTWQEVHRLLYDALVASGTDPTKAKIMFAAVWLGGPRWYEDGRSDSTIAVVSPALKIAAMQKAMAMIRKNRPGMPELVAYLQRIEREMLEAARAEERDAPAPAPVDPGVDVIVAI
jgi:hypothetical protein